MGLDMCNGNITGLESASGSVTYNDNKPWYCAVRYTDWKSSSTKICRFFTVNYPTTWKFYWKSLDSTEFLPALPNRWLFLVYLSFIHSSNNTVSKIAQVIEKSWYEGGPFFVILLYESINYRCEKPKSLKECVPFNSRILLQTYFSVGTELQWNDMNPFALKRLQNLIMN